MPSPDYSKRSYRLPKGCKDLADVIKLHKPKTPLPARSGDTRALMSEAESKKFEAELEREIEIGSNQMPPITGEIIVSEATRVSELAAMLGQKPFRIIADLMEIGVFASLKQSVDFEAVSKVARKYGYAVKMRA